MELDSLYQEVILDHYKRPQHKGLAAEFDAQVHHVNPSCGDEITLNVKLAGELVAAITWDGVGCSISQASVSILSDLLLGKSIADADFVLSNFTELMQSKGTMAGDDEILEEDVAEYEWEKEWREGKNFSTGFKANKEDNYYTMLGLEKDFMNTSQEEIRRAYKKYALVHHPDKKETNTEEEKAEAKK